MNKCEFSSKACLGIHRIKFLSFIYITLLIVIMISHIQGKFTLKVKSPIMLEKHFGKNGINNVQILEGTEKFIFEEVLNIVTFDKKSKIGCKKFDMSISKKC
jgi:hypothetical protein